MSKFQFFFVGWTPIAHWSYGDPRYNGKSAVESGQWTWTANYLGGFLEKRENRPDQMPSFLQVNQTDGQVPIPSAKTSVTNHDINAINFYTGMSSTQRLMLLNNASTNLTAAGFQGLPNACFNKAQQAGPHCATMISDPKLTNFQTSWNTITINGKFMNKLVLRASRCARFV